LSNAAQYTFTTAPSLPKTNRTDRMPQAETPAGEVSSDARRRRALILTLGLGAIIFVVTMVPVETPPPVPGTDKLHHLVAFAALTLPCAALWPRALPWILPCIVAEAALIEIVQPYVGRLRELSDFVADVKGIGIGLAAGLTIAAIRHLVAKRRQRP